MARAPKRHVPQYVKHAQDGVDYVVDIANREVLKNWVSIEAKDAPGILSACLLANPELALALATA